MALPEGRIRNIPTTEGGSQHRPQSFYSFSLFMARSNGRDNSVSVFDLKTHHVFLATAEFGPAPAPTPEQPRPRPAVLPGMFMVLEFGK